MKKIHFTDAAFPFVIERPKNWMFQCDVAWSIEAPKLILSSKYKTVSCTLGVLPGQLGVQRARTQGGCHGIRSCDEAIVQDIIYGVLIL
jgi:hypothetical protein